MMIRRPPLAPGGIRCAPQRPCFFRRRMLLRTTHAADNDGVGVESPWALWATTSLRPHVHVHNCFCSLVADMASLRQGVVPGP